MKFTLETSSGVNLIRAYSAGEIHVQGQIIRTSVVLSADHILQPWRPRRVEELTRSDFDTVLKWGPELLLLGTGERLEFPDRVLMSEVLNLGVGFEVMDTGAACRTYNVLVHENRAVAVALLMEPQSPL